MLFTFVRASVLLNLFWCLLALWKSLQKLYCLLLLPVSQIDILLLSLFLCLFVWFRKYCSSRLHLPLRWSRLPVKKTFVCHDKLLFTLPVFVMLRWSRTYVLTHVGLELHWRKSSDISTTLDIWQIFSFLRIPVMVTWSVFLPCPGNCPLAKVQENSSCRKVITTSMYDYNL